MSHIKFKKGKGGAAITVYLDELFAVEFVMNYLILMIYCQRNQKKYTWLSKIAVTLFTTVLSVWIICFLLSASKWNRCYSIIGAAAAAFGELWMLERMNREKTGFCRRIPCVFQLFSAAVLMAGGLFLLLEGKKGISMIDIMGTASVFACVLCGLDRYRKWGRKEQPGCVQVVITLLGNTYTVTAITDTGNQLYDPVSRQPIHIIERNILFDDIQQEMLLRKEPERFSFVPYASLGTRDGILTAVWVEKMQIWDGNTKTERINQKLGLAMQPIGRKQSWQMLLHPDWQKES